MNREALLAELNGLLDVGEPLLDVYPEAHQGGWWFQLPDNISHEMELYAKAVAWRAWDREQYRVFHQRDSTDYLAGLVNDLEAGLLGWRAIGVLK